MPDTAAPQKVVRVDDDVYDALMEIVHKLERDEGRRLSMNDAVRELLERRAG